MKKVFISILLFYLSFHYLFPLVYYIAFGFVNTYSNIYDESSLIKAFMLNSISILVAILIIIFIPSKKVLKQPTFKHTGKLYFIAAILSVSSFFIYGGYRGAITGESQGTLLSYIRLFFDLPTILIVLFFFQKKPIRPYWIIFIYVIVLTLSGSRSAVIMIILLFLMFPMFSNGYLYRRKVLGALKFLIIFAPFLFIISTAIRGYESNKVLDLIVGRVSFLELNTIAIFKADTDKANMDLFDEKYGAVNQFEQVINAISPIDPFNYDVDPNQYFRSIFMGLPKHNVLDRYMSINLTLPVYFYLKYGAFFACLITIIFLISVFLILNKFFNNVYIVLVILVNFYSILYFFDWVMIFKGIYTSFLTVFFINRYECFCAVFNRTINRILQQPLKTNYL